jgi:hypothetical protein
MAAVGDGAPAGATGVGKWAIGLGEAALLCRLKAGACASKSVTSAPLMPSNTNVSAVTGAPGAGA